MDKKLVIGLGLLGAVGLIWYFKKKSSSASGTGDMLRSGTDLEAPVEEAMSMEETSMEAPMGGGGGGGASAPAMMAEMAKDELKSKMDMGGIDMTSPKAEKGAMATAMVQAMMAQGKTPPKDLISMMIKSPLPTATKKEMAVKTANTMSAMMGKPPVKVVTPAPKVVAPAPKVVAPAPKVATLAPKVATLAPKVLAPAPKVGLTMQSIPKMAAPAPKVATPAPKVATPAPKVVAPAPKVVAPAPKTTAKFDGLDDFDFDGNF